MRLTYGIWLPLQFIFLCCFIKKHKYRIVNGKLFPKQWETVQCAQVYEWSRFNQSTYMIFYFFIYEFIIEAIKNVVLLTKKTIFLKGKFPQTTMWIGWVESNFTNPTVRVWSDLDNPFKRSEKCKVVRPLWMEPLPEYVRSQEDNSPFTLYIDFHFFFSFLDINSPFDQVHS